MPADNSDYPLAVPQFQSIPLLRFILAEKFILKAIIGTHFIMFGKFHADPPMKSLTATILTAHFKLTTTYTIRSLSHQSIIHLSIFQFEWVMVIHNLFASQGAILTGSPTIKTAESMVCHGKLIVSRQ